MAAEYSANELQTVEPGQSVIFTESPVPCNRGFIFHRDESGLFYLSSRGQKQYCCGGNVMTPEALYEVGFHANIQIPADGTVDTISLAIAIGTAHGAYKFKPGQKPQLRFDILEEIQEKLPGFPLVLHGASSVPQDRLAIFNHYGGDLAQAIGIPGDMLRKAASMAVCKINVGTDIRVCWFGELRRQFAENPKKFDGRSFIGPAQKAVAEMVAARITDVFGSNGKA